MKILIRQFRWFCILLLVIVALGITPALALFMWLHDEWYKRVEG